MKTGIALARQIRAMEFPDECARELRTMYLAQAMAYSVPLNTDDTVPALAARCRAKFSAVLNEVNEVITVDTVLALNVFTKLLKIRLELLQGVGDPAILMAALESTEQQARFTDDDLRVFRAVTTRSDFIERQHAADEILTEYFAVTDDE